MFRSMAKKVKGKNLSGYSAEPKRAVMAKIVSHNEAPILYVKAC